MPSIQELSYNHPLLTRALDGLQVNQVIKDHQSRTAFRLKNEEIRKVGWLASILADSESESHKQRAQTIATLLYLNNLDSIEVAKLSYIILSRTGNLLATKFIKSIFSSNAESEDELFFSEEFDILLDFELGFKRIHNLIEIQNEQIPATDFQIRLWQQLSKDVNIAISAPTSGGKSFVIQNYIKKCFQELNEFTAIYIVPTKALITQVSQSFRTILNRDVTVLTGFIDVLKDIITPSKVLYVVTPERCMRLLQQGWKSLLYPDFIFLDEIQNVERPDSRGLLLEYVLNEISTLWPSTRVVIAGPMIEKLDELFLEIADRTSSLVETHLSPVFQIKVAVKSTERNRLKLSIYTSSNHFTTVTIDVELDLVKAFSSSHGKAISEVAVLLGIGSQNIIYAPKTNYAEFWCRKLVETLQEKGIQAKDEQETSVKELIRFISEEIHPLYYLKDFLKYGVAFHHGKLPEIVRDEVEDLYVNKQLQFLVCTSTLLEGVNLPASKIFIIHANKDQDPLSKFDFGNLIGRAGRIKDAFFGTVYGIEKPSTIDSINWTDDYFNSSANKELTTAAKKTLKEKFNEVIIEVSKPVIDIIDAAVSNTLIFLRLKALQGHTALKNYLVNKKLSEEQVSRIINSVSDTVKSISLKYGTLRLNPTIDPLLQEILYKRILQEGIQNWVVVRNGVKYMSNDEASKVPLFERSLFQQLVHLFIKLDQIFKIESETYKRFRISMRIGQMVYYGHRWMQGISLGALIKNDIDFYATHSNPARRIDNTSQKDVNERINSVIKIQSSVVSFILVKYMKVCNDVLESIMSEDEKTLYSFSLSLPTKLELGTLDTVVATLISAGLPRNLALKISPLIPLSSKEDPLRWIRNQKSLPVNEIYLKHLKRRNLL